MAIELALSELAKEAIAVKSMEAAQQLSQKLATVNLEQTQIAQSVEETNSQNNFRIGELESPDLEKKEFLEEREQNASSDLHEKVDISNEESSDRFVGQSELSAPSLEKRDWASAYDSDSKQFYLETNRDSHLLNGELPTDVTISTYNNSTDTRIVYETDGLSRCKSAQCPELKMAEGTRNQYQQSLCNNLKDGIQGHDDAGHLIAREFGGCGEQINLIPMDSYVNRHGEWRYLEQSWEKTLGDGGTINDIKIEPYYDGDCKRPTGFDVSFKRNEKSEYIYIDNTSRVDTNLTKGA